MTSQRNEDPGLISMKKDGRGEDFDDTRTIN
jgi:hypothetical protein